RVAGLFESTGNKTTRHADMRAWLWRHYALNAGFLALTLSRGLLRSIYRSSPITQRMMNIHGDPAYLADTPFRLLKEARRLRVACPRLDTAMAIFEGALLATVRSEFETATARSAGA
ncbi:MAG: hypothetical protein Q8M76_07805, partial [Spirochaetaceae bacterium]|nr:hypothetical protein [Spirochaetaceae bacterium]